MIFKAVDLAQDEGVTRATARLYRPLLSPRYFCRKQGAGVPSSHVLGHSHEGLMTKIPNSLFAVVGRICCIRSFVIPTRAIHRVAVKVRSPLPSPAFPVIVSLFIFDEDIDVSLEDAELL